MTEQAALVLVSNRGPVTYQEDGSVKRGTGGLVTALTGLASHRDAIWIASAMTEQDVDVAREHGGKPFEVEAPEGGSFRVRFVESEDEAYDRFYNIIANPMLWFIQHYLWDLSNAPDIRRHEVVAFEEGYQQVNRDLAEAVVDEIDGQHEPVVMVHDYHLYTLPAMVREARPDVFLHHFVHIPWTQPDAWRVLPKYMRDEIYKGLLANDIIGFHTRSYQRNFLQCCRDLMDLDVSFDDGIVVCEGREVWVRAYPLPIDYEAPVRWPGGRACASSRSSVLARRREYAILRVDRADLPRTCCAGSRPSTSSWSSTPSSPSASPSPPSSCRPGPTCPSTPSTWRRSRRWSPWSTTATAPRTGCRSISSCATTWTRPSPPTSTTT